MYFSILCLTLFSLVPTVFSAPMPEVQLRQAFRPQLTFQGVDYRDSYSLSTPGDGTVVIISMLPPYFSVYAFKI